MDEVDPFRVQIVSMPDDVAREIRNQAIAYGLGAVITGLGAILTDVALHAIKRRRELKAALKKLEEAEKAETK